MAFRKHYTPPDPPPLEIPEALQGLLSDMKSGAGMMRAKDFVLNECIRIYGIVPAMNDWDKELIKHKIPRQGPKDILSVQRALVHMWEIGKYMERRAKQQALFEQPKEAEGYGVD